MNRVICDSKILGGKPIIKNTRIAVYIILDMLSSGYNSDDIVKEYPHLSKQDITACLKYASGSTIV